mmetsp:Transcript_63251/g.110391  ORF Transcript_63251/g.110391 Transcript_63251/m.110391 type:complete len:87 (-) Transcript_63251:69-329(-)
MVHFACALRIHTEAGFPGSLPSCDVLAFLREVDRPTKFMSQIPCWRTSSGHLLTANRSWEQLEAKLGKLTAGLNAAINLVWQALQY